MKPLLLALTLTVAVVGVFGYLAPTERKCVRYEIEIRRMLNFKTGEFKLVETKICKEWDRAE